MRLGEAGRESVALKVLVDGTPSTCSSCAARRWSAIDCARPLKGPSPADDRSRSGTDRPGAGLATIDVPDLSSTAPAKTDYTALSMAPILYAE
jgi:hypothetical protein